MEFIEKTLGEWMDHIADTHPDRPAVVFDDMFEYRRTYREFNDECNRYAKSLMALGIKKGDHVAIWATNYPQWLLTLFASAKIGAVLVTVNTSYKIYEAEYLLRQSDSKMLVMCDGYKDVSYVGIMNELCPEIAESDRSDLNLKRLPCLKTIVTIDQNTYPGMYNWNELDAMADTVSDEEYNAVKATLTCHDVVNMQYTSGTTGFPKGVMLTHYNILNNGKSIGDRMKFTENDRLCITVPLFHCFGLVLAVMASITHVTAMVLVNYFSPIKVLKTLQAEQCTALHGVPTMFIAVLAHPDFNTFKFNLRTGIMAGSPCPIKVMQQVIDEMSATEITIVFGQTESSPGCTQTTTDDTIEHRVNSVGRAFEGVETKIVDPETGKTLGPGTIGEFCARGYNIMKGYYKMPEATAQVIDAEGWLHTGDLASVDEEGYYKITGRIKDMIIRGGENIYPKEIEDFIYTHPKVKDVQVIGVPSKRYGEEICACIIPHDNVIITEDEVKEYVQSHMAKYKTPSYVMFVEQFPMTASGKIQKFKLRETAIETLSLHEAAKIETA
ncbi:MAG: AMP-binding protein [Oscillospiraceae bacterium]|nr:AMP-binding protein [Oscillospiraceae bacterium]